MKLIYRMAAGLLIIIIPFVAITVSANILARLPDVYSFQFAKSQITEEIDLAIRPAEIGALFSSYLTGGTDEFQIISEYQGREQQIFTMRDQIGMFEARRHINWMLLFSILAIIIVVLLSFWLIRVREKQMLRTAFKYCVGLFFIFWIMTLLAPTKDSFSALLQKLIFTGGFGEESILGMLLSDAFFDIWLTFTLVGSFILLFIIGNIIWKFSKERRMFDY